MGFNKFVSVVCVLFLLFFSSLQIVRSKDILIEDFTSRMDSTWLYRQGDGSIGYSGSSIVLRSDGTNFPYVLLKENMNLQKDIDFSIDTRFKFDRLGSSGDGISFGFTGSFGNFSLFSVWLDVENGFHFFYNDFSSSENQGRCQDFSRARDMLGRKYYKFFGYNSLNWHVLTVERRGGVYTFYLDRDNNPIPFFTSSNTDCVPKIIWLGNANDGNVNWSNLQIDNIFVRDVRIVHNKIILLPGMGASWNPKAMVAGETVGADEWSMTPFVGNYNALVKAFEDNGLVKNTDFWVWNYDWRKPISETVSTFNTFVNSKVLAGEKFDLVGHSMGGLVASDWARLNSNDARLNKVITLGSPHYGAVKAYGAWMGAQISDKFDFGSIALKVLLTLNRGKDESELATVRRIAPSVKDLLPTFNYIKVGSRVVPAANLSVQNQWALVHGVLGPILTKLKTVVAVGQPTLEWLSLGEPSAHERKLSYWPDGKPISRSFGDGDATVLKKSATMSGAGLISVASNHGAMVDASVNQVLAELDLGVTAVVTPVDYSATKLVFYLGSPAIMAVLCSGMTGPVMDTDGWVVIDSGPSQCQVNLTGTGSGGTYHLVTGRSDSDVPWSYFEEKIGVGETRNVILETRKMQLIGNGGIDYLYGLMKSDNDLLLVSYPGHADLLALAGFIVARNETRLMESLFKFRKLTKEMAISSRMVDNLVTILTLKNGSTLKVEADVARKKATDLKLKVDTNTRLLGGRKVYPSVFGSASYLQADKMLGKYATDSVEANWPNIWSNSTVASQLLGEVW
jgi:pimeloyl-ACP methyl ester carboxylesterase